MESFGNKRKVRQGEDWSLSLNLLAGDEPDVPYIVSSELDNPFFVVTVASTKYEKNLRYVKSWWNEVNSVRFYQTTPLYVGELASINDLPENASVVGEVANENYLYQYTLIGDNIDKKLGRKPYYYYYFDHSQPNSPRIDGYNCEVIFNFFSKDTVEWSSQNYLYQLSLVTGKPMDYVLDSIARQHTDYGDLPLDFPTTIDAQYEYVKTRWGDELQPDIDVSSPLGSIDSVEPILPPTELSVENNLRQLI